MDSIKIHIVYDHESPSDEVTVGQLAEKLRDEFKRRSLAIEPTIVLTSGFVNLPEATEMEPLSLVCLALPEKSRNGFKPEERERIKAFRQGCARGDVRLVPIAFEQTRDVPPEPLGGIVSQKVHDIMDPPTIVRLSNFLLNLACLRLSGGKRKLFISYKLSDGGKEIATHLASRLKERGYDVWRDELLDRDGIPFIGPGTEAQETIERAIKEHGFVLVLDTPQASQSKWVHAEIETGYSMMLPILPVVVEDPGLLQQPQAPMGGNFIILRNMQREERITVSQINAPPPAGVIAAMNDDFFDRLDQRINQVLTDHLRTRLGLLRDTEKNFRDLQFAEFRPISPANLVYEALRSLQTPLAPRMFFRLIVQCAPYEALQEDLLDNLAAQFAAAPGPTQYAILVHPIPINSTDKERLLRLSKGHLLVLAPTEISKIPSIFDLQTGGAT